MNFGITSEAAKRVNEIAKRHAGTVTPQQIVADAKKKSSPLHAYFVWDIAKAASEHWLETARCIIRSVRVDMVVHRQNVSTVAYVRDPRKSYHDSGYMHIETVAANTEDSAAVLECELSRAATIIQRTFSIADALGLRREAEAALRGVVGLREAAKKANASRKPTRPPARV